MLIPEQAMLVGLGEATRWTSFVRATLQLALILAAQADVTDLFHFLLHHFQQR